jgi:serine protease Do
VLLTYNGENIVGTQQLGRLVSETPPGRRISVHVWRNGLTRSLWLVTEVKQQPEAVIPELTLPGADIPGTVIVWRSRILGTVCETLLPQLTNFFGVPRGVLVRYVDKGALGDLSGLKAGDVIVASSDRAILNPRDLTGALLSEAGVLHAARFAVWREHKRIFIDVHPAE